MKTNNEINNLYNNLKETFINNNDKNNSNNNNIESFRVYIRIRPFLPKDFIINKNNSNLSKNISPKNSKKDILEKMIKIENNILYLEDIKAHKNKNNKVFVFDNIFTESSNNKDVFKESIKEMIDKVLQGYNSTALAYGVTGTGKTYTIFGDLSNGFKEEGIIFKACDYLFEKIELNKKENINNTIINNNDEINYYIKISYIEIYNEIVKDLISENSTSLIIVEDPQKGVICPNAKEIIINDSFELKKIINESNKRRTMANTTQNQFSSRSHAILQMILEKKIKKSEDNYEIFFSKFLVVDLAGSERGMERGKRREEGVNINKSLFTLGSCLNILSEKSNTGKFIPYRDSKLTRLLKDSLGGNILTVMLACISPCPASYDETLNTLNYAFKAKKITKKVMKNIKEIDINNFQYKEIIDTLKSEIMQLKKVIKSQEIKLKEKIINNKEEISKENTSSNEKEIIENKMKIKDSESIQTNENHNKFDSLNFTDNNKNISNFFEKNEINSPISERDITIKEKNIKFNINPPIDEEINIQIYNKYLEEIINNEVNINNINHQIEKLKKDKNILETILMKDNIKNDALLNKYNLIKNIYDKYIEIINEKLVENIEQNMVYNFNIKEITELNKTNIDKVKELEQLKLESGGKNEKIEEEINYTNKNILENNAQKEQIYESIKKNNEQKDELKKILLNLLENKSDYSMNKYIHILLEKDKLFKITKQYEKQIENYVKLQKQKDEDMIKINRKIEMLRAKLKEKDKKINELVKKGGRSKLELNNIKSFHTNYKNTLNINRNSPTESQIFTEKTKSQNKYNSYRITNVKRNNSRNNKEINNSTPPKNNKTNNSKRFREKKVIEEKNISNNKSFNQNRKRLTIIPNPNNDNSRINKKYNNINVKNIKIENNNDQNTINNTNVNDYFLQQKFNEYIIPKTTITLANNYSKKIKEINPIYLKTDKNINRIKTTPTNNFNNYKKYSFIKQKNDKRNSSSNNTEKNISKYNHSKNSIKSVKIDFKKNNNSELNKIEKNNNNIDTNLTNDKIFKAEKINIDLTNINRYNSLEISLKDKINNIKLLKINNDKAKTNNSKEIFKKTQSNKKNIINNNKNSNSNPKISNEKKLKNNKIKKLNLQEARYENKLKYDKNTNEKVELISAECFINDYKKLKTNETLKKNYIKKINNITNNNPLNNEEENEKNNDVKSLFIDIHENKNDKKNKDNIIDENLENKDKEKKEKKKEENDNENTDKSGSTIIYNIYIDKREKKVNKDKKDKEKNEKINS